jgi:ElaA protein
LGVALMRESMDYALKQFKAKKIIISAQFRLKGFYENLGFIAVGEIYLEDNIDHIEMHYEV